MIACTWIVRWKAGRSSATASTCVPITRGGWVHSTRPLHKRESLIAPPALRLAQAQRLFIGGQRLFLLAQLDI